MELLKNDKGGVLVFTLMIILVLSMLGLAMLPLTIMEYKTSSNFANYQKAYFLAEAGIEEAVATLSQGDWDYDGGTGEFSEVGNYSISIDGDDDTKTITATGEIGSISRTIEATVKKEQGERIDLGTIANKYALFSNGDMNLEQGATINGDININGNLKIKNNFSGKGIIKVNTIDMHKELSSNFKLELGNPESISSVFNIENYIDFLNKTKLENDSKIHVREGNTEANLERESLDGIIIINADTIKFKFTEINGIIITNAKKIEVTGNGTEINGSIICTEEQQSGPNHQITINHDKVKIQELIENYRDVLEIDDLNGEHSSNTPVVVQEWREID